VRSPLQLLTEVIFLRTRIDLEKLQKRMPKPENDDDGSSTSSSSSSNG